LPRARHARSNIRRTLLITAGGKALAGLGLAYLPEDQVEDHLAYGRLIRVLDDWCPPFSGYHLYYPSRRQLTPAFALLVEVLRYRG
jgi:DNA-binding transcriptional LysR family regulator